MNKLTFAVVTALTLSTANLLAMKNGTDPSEIDVPPFTPPPMQQTTSFVVLKNGQFLVSEGEESEGEEESVFEPRYHSSRRIKSPKFPETPRPKPAARRSNPSPTKLPAPATSKPRTTSPSMEDETKEDFARVFVHQRTVGLVPEIKESLEKPVQPEGVHRTLTGMTFEEIESHSLEEIIKRTQSVVTPEKVGEDDQ